MLTMWPQFVILFLLVMGLGISLARDGDLKQGRESFVTSLISTVVMVWLLYEGGFFNLMLK